MICLQTDPIDRTGDADERGQIPQMQPQAMRITWVHDDNDKTTSQQPEINGSPGADQNSDSIEQLVESLLETMSGKSSEDGEDRPECDRLGDPESDSKHEDIDHVQESVGAGDPRGGTDKQVVRARVPFLDESQWRLVFIRNSCQDFLFIYL